MTVRPHQGNCIQNNKFVPQLESLESRWLPTTIGQVGNIVHVNGDGGANTIQITDTGGRTAGSVRVVAGAQQFSSTAVVREIRVRTIDGNDRVTYTQTGRMDAGLFRRLDVDLGSGADVCTVVLRHGVEAGVYHDIYVHGNTGNDTLVVNATANVDVAGGGTIRWWLVAGDENDVVRTTYVGEVDGQLLTRVENNPGKDVANAVYTIRTGSTGLAAAHMFGGTNLDHLSLLVRKQGPSPVRIDAFADGGQFLDYLTRTANVRTKNAEFITNVV
jgi:hypothetical protein